MALRHHRPPYEYGTNIRFNYFSKIHYNLIYYLKSCKHGMRLLGQAPKSIKIVKFKKNSIISGSGLKSGVF